MVTYDLGILHECMCVLMENLKNIISRKVAIWVRCVTLRIIDLEMLSQGPQEFESSLDSR